MTLTDNSGKAMKACELMNTRAAAINQCIRHEKHPVLFLSLFRFGLLTRMASVWIICAIIVELVAGEMSLSSFPCYKPKPMNYRMGLKIVGGSNADQSKTPYMVGLMKHGGIVCGASIISENFLVLAAHCVCNNQNDIIKPTQLKAFVGMNKLSEAKAINENTIEDEGVTEVFIGKIITHPNYACGKTTENDIGEISFTIPCDVSLKSFDFSSALAPEISH